MLWLMVSMIVRITVSVRLSQYHYHHYNPPNIHPPMFMITITDMKERASLPSLISHQYLLIERNLNKKIYSCVSAVKKLILSVIDYTQVLGGRPHTSGLQEITNGFGIFILRYIKSPGAMAPLSEGWPRQRAPSLISFLKPLMPAYIHLGKCRAALFILAKCSFCILHLQGSTVSVGVPLPAPLQQRKGEGICRTVGISPRPHHHSPFAPFARCWTVLSTLAFARGPPHSSHEAVCLSHIYYPHILQCLLPEALMPHISVASKIPGDPRHLKLSAPCNTPHLASLSAFFRLRFSCTWTLNSIRTYLQLPSPINSQTRMPVTVFFLLSQLHAPGHQ